MEATYFVIANRFPVRGLHGGQAGGLARYILREGSPEEKVLEEVGANEPLAPGCSYFTQYPGGGGWGDPLERDPSRVREDVLDEYVSLEGARRDYGVVLDPGSLEIDGKATEILRRERHSPSTSAARNSAGW